jgi:predicted transcriptional regulator
VAEKRDPPTSLRLDPGMLARLKRIKTAEGDRSISSIIKQAVEEFITRWEAGKKKK